MANKNLQDLVNKSRGTVKKNQIGVDAPAKFKFGQSKYYEDGGEFTIGLFNADDEGNQLEGVKKSTFSDGTLNSREGFKNLIMESINKNKG